MERLNLAEALASDRLTDFASQAEAEGIGPIDRAQFEKMVGRVTTPPPEDQTSHLPAADCSHGK